MEKISGVYKITNTITGDFYIGSSKDVKKRWANHKCYSKWTSYINSRMYNDMSKYGIDKFQFSIIELVDPLFLKCVEQKYIDLLEPTYNNFRVIGLDTERHIKYQRKYQKDYKKSDKGIDVSRRASNKYYNKTCLYEGEEIKLGTLIARLKRYGISNPTQEASKYLIK